MSATSPYPSSSSFAAVSQYCEVRLNEKLLSAHEGGCLPFEFALPEEIVQAKNQVELVRCC